MVQLKKVFYKEAPSGVMLEIPFFLTNLGGCHIKPASLFHLEDGFFLHSFLLVPWVESSICPMWKTLLIFFPSKFDSKSSISQLSKLYHSSPDPSDIWVSGFGKISSDRDRVEISLENLVGTSVQKPWRKTQLKFGGRVRFEGGFEGLQKMLFSSELSPLMGWNCPWPSELAGSNKAAELVPRFSGPTKLFAWASKEGARPMEKGPEAITGSPIILLSPDFTRPVSICIWEPGLVKHTPTKSVHGVWEHVSLSGSPRVESKFVILSY